ncbi:MAG: hypothetical protein J6R38_01960 [Alistipes sp.]|nr:hypothetical protein [Alistipes sp.]
MKARFLALAALVLGLASCQNDPEIVNPVVDGEVDFQLAVGVPELGTRAADVDGEGGNTQYGYDSAYGAIDYLCDEADALRTDWTDVDLRYSLEVYDADNLTTPVKDRQVIIVDKYEPVAFDLRLVPGRPYRFVVFADFVEQGADANPAIDVQDDLGLHHIIGDNLGDIKIKNDGINDECTDAYFAVKDITISNSAAQDMELKRPYGKLRVIATDLAELNINVDPAAVVVTYDAYHPNAFNAVTGAIGGEYVTENYVSVYNDGVCKLNLANHFYTEDYDNKKATNKDGVQRHTHMTLFTDYILANEQQAPIHFTMNVYQTATKNGEEYVFSNPIKETHFNTEIPVQRNFLTTIVGNVLTTATEIKVTIDDNFAEKELVVDIWDGKSKTEPETVVDENGNTTAVIDSAADLAWLADFVNNPTTRATAQPVNFVLAADIDLDNQPWAPIGTEANNFVGTFNGNGHSIKNLNIVETEAKEGKAYMGLLGYAKNATVKNLTLENVYINVACLDIDHSQGHIGAVAGSLEGTSTIENVTVKGDIKVYATQDANGASRVAVVAGGNSYGDVTMKNVHVIANKGSYLTANNNTGALAGQLQGKMVFENCSSNINVTVNKFFAGGLIGIAAGDSKFVNCHTTGDVAVVAGRAGRANDHYRVGGIAGGWADGKTKVCTLENCSYEGTISGTNADGSVAEAFDYAGYVGRGYTLSNCAGSKVVIDGVEYVQVYDNIYGVYYVNGAYEVNTAADLKALANDVNAGNTFDGKTVVLTADIDLKNENWTPIGYWQTFNGTFDGQNHTISNLKHHGTEEDCYVGLFGYTENATIKNLTINNVDLKLIANASWAGGHMGALVGNIEGETVIENITVSGNVKIDGDMEKAGAGRIGGVVGGNASKVSLKNVVVNANEGSFVKGNSSIGGIAGQLQGETTFENCSSNINVSAQQFYAGGIIGLTYRITSFTNCTASGNISVLAGRAGNDNDLYRVGGIAGGWDEDDNGEYVLPLVNCSTTCVLAGASADGRTATAFDCDGFVGRGYGAKVGAQVSVNGTVYEYAGEGVYKIGDSYVVNTGDALVAALAQEYNVTFGKDLKIDPANMSNAYGKTGVLVYEGQSIDGAGHKLDVKGAGGTWDSGICTSGGLIKNLWVTGSFRGVFVKGATHTEKVVLENVRLEGTTYTISCDSASGQGLEATNSIFRGWTSYAKTIGNVKFDGCTFGAGNGYNFSRPYAPTEYVNCTFEAGHQIDPRAAITFENCTLNGVALTAENLSTLVVSNIANATIK